MSFLGIIGGTPSAKKLRGDLQRLLRDYPQYTFLIKLYWVKLKMVISEEERSLRYGKALQKLFDEQEREEEMIIDDQRRKELLEQDLRMLQQRVEKEHNDFANMMIGMGLITDQLNAQLKNVPSGQTPPSIDLTMNPKEFKNSLATNPINVMSMKELEPFQNFLKFVNDIQNQTAAFMDNAGYAAQSMLTQFNDLKENAAYLGQFINDQLKKISGNQLDLNKMSLDQPAPNPNQPTNLTNQLIPDPIVAANNEISQITNFTPDQNISNAASLQTPTQTATPTPAPTPDSASTSPISAAPIPKPAPSAAPTPAEGATAMNAAPKPAPAPQKTQDASIFHMASTLKSLETDYLAKQKQGKISEKLTEKEIQDRMKHAPATLVGPYIKGHYTKEKMSEIEKNLKQQSKDVQSQSAEATPAENVEKKKKIKPMPPGHGNLGGH